jgi:predicted dinucleotide-binding enzyme
MQDAVKADMVFLAMPFGTQTEVAKAAESWQGKIVIDVTNAYGVPPEELGNLPSSVVVSKAFPGAKFVKAFNHLQAEVLAEDPNVEGGQRVVFVSSDDDEAAAQVATLATELGFAPVRLGKLAEGGLLVQARGKTWAPLIFQDLFKKGKTNVQPRDLASPI